MEVHGVQCRQHLGCLQVMFYFENENKLSRNLDPTQKVASLIVFRGRLLYDLVSFGSGCDRHFRSIIKFVRQNAFLCGMICIIYLLIFSWESLCLNSTKIKCQKPLKISEHSVLERKE